MDASQLIVRRLKDGERTLIEGWWTSQGKVPPPVWMTGPLGLVVEKAGELLACGFLLTTNSELCFFECMQTNPKLQNFTRAKAFRKLIIAAIDLAKMMGFRGIFGLVPADGAHDSIEKLYGRLGGARIPFSGFYREV